MYLKIKRQKKTPKNMQSFQKYVSEALLSWVKWFKKNYYSPTTACIKYFHKSEGIFHILLFKNIFFDGSRYSFFSSLVSYFFNFSLALFETNQPTSSLCIYCSAAALLALIISDQRCPLCVYAVDTHTDTHCLSVALVHAEKADTSGGSVIEQILLPTSHCRGGWRSCWNKKVVVGGEELGERANEVCLSVTCGYV